MNVGDVVKYVGVDIATESGKYLCIWLPFYIYNRGDMGIICGKRTVYYDMPNDMKMVEKYEVRMMPKYECLTHNIDSFYEFELEKA